MFLCAFAIDSQDPWLYMRSGARKNHPFDLSVLKASCPFDKEIFKHIQAYFKCFQRIFKEYVKYIYLAV
jgi:hypothetical protein